MKHKSIHIDTLEIFYREAGDPTKQTLLLLHGLPSTSAMYTDLMQRLSTDFHLVAPDYPGFGMSACPAPEEFEYSFDHLGQVMLDFVAALQLHSFHLYMQDYGGPVGFRIACARPELIQSLIIQNANAYIEGLGPYPQNIGKLAAENNLAELERLKDDLFSLEGIKMQYLKGATDTTKVDPALYHLDYYFMQRPGIKTLQYRLFDNYASNFCRYDEWQAYFRSQQPKTLILWGDGDPFFTVAGAQAYLGDLPGATIHLYNGSHCMLAEYAPEVTQHIKKFIHQQ
ncbi:MAG TPA: alpha/beta hydrolase [Cytophagales bacterium]|nr:alpha/beta hydrolase [Cytophagales bacterium]